MHLGGVWERQIGTVRHVLDGMLLGIGRTQLTHELWGTLVVEVTGIVNSRPISAVPSDIHELPPFTPTILCCLWWRLDPPLAPHLGTFVPLDLYARNWWRGAQYLANQFWVRWKREYRQNLQNRPKWQKRKHNLSVGDIVLVKEDNTNRNDWSLRRISVLVRITDVKVRRAQVTSYRTGNAKIYEQPISSFNILMKWEEEA